MNRKTESLRNNGEEHRGFLHWVKKSRILLFYRLRKLRNKFSFAYLLFIFSFALFLLILIPNLAHRMSIPGENWPLVLELHGRTLTRANASDPNSSLIPLPFVQIEIGGYSTVSTLDGVFDIRFSSRSFEDVPVNLSWDNRTRMVRVSFQHGQFYKTMEFTLER